MNCHCGKSAVHHQFQSFEYWFCVDCKKEVQEGLPGDISVSSSNSAVSAMRTSTPNPVPPGKKRFIIAIGDQEFCIDWDEGDVYDAAAV